MVKETSLPNGIKIVTESISGVRSISVGIWVKIGSRDEIEGLNGMTHFLEHMLFKDTKNFTAKQISEIFDSLGGEFNAFTSKEFTCYYARLLDEHLPIGIELLADMMQQSKLKKPHIEVERGIILEEINRHEDNPASKIHDLFSQTLWESHPLGQSIIGQSELVKSFNKQSIQEFYKKNYVSNNMIITLAGNLNHNEVVDLLKKYFRNQRIGPVNLRDHSIPKPETRVKIIEKDTEQANICYGSVSLKANDERRFALSVFDNILGGGMSSRLFQKIREEMGLAYAIFSFHSLYLDTGLFSIYTGINPSKVKEVISTLNREIKEILKEGPTEEEIIRAKENLKGELVLSLENTANRMTRLGKSILNHGQILTIDELISKLDDVSFEDVMEVGRLIFNPKRMVLAVIGPVKAKEIEDFYLSEDGKLCIE